MCKIDNRHYIWVFRCQWCMAKVFDCSMKVLGPCLIATAVVLIGGISVAYFTHLLPLLVRTFSLAWLVLSVFGLFLLHNIMFNYVMCVLTRAGGPPTAPVAWRPEALCRMRRRELDKVMGVGGDPGGHDGGGDAAGAGAGAGGSGGGGGEGGGEGSGEGGGEGGGEGEDAPVRREGGGALFVFRAGSAQSAVPGSGKGGERSRRGGRKPARGKSGGKGGGAQGGAYEHVDTRLLRPGGDEDDEDDEGGGGGGGARGSDDDGGGGDGGGGGGDGGDWRDSARVWMPRHEVDRVYLKRQGFRWCKKCRDHKPPRAHHCHVSRACVLQMDHFCPWVHTCVGWGNYRYFFLFLQWLVCGCYYCVALTCYPFYLNSRFHRGGGSAAADAAAAAVAGPGGGQLATMSTLLGRGAARPGREARRVLSFVFLITLSVGLAVSCLYAFHLFLVLRAETTIEFYQNRMKAAKMRRRGQIFVNPYDLGRGKNWEQVFGPGSSASKLAWFLSILPSRRAPPEPHIPDVGAVEMEALLA